MNHTNGVAPIESNRIEDATDRLLSRVERELGLTPIELAGALGESLRTVSRWRAGETLPQRSARTRLAEVAELNHRLHETFESEADLVYVDGRLIPPSALKERDLPPDAKFYTWETLPAGME